MSVLIVDAIMSPNPITIIDIFLFLQKYKNLFIAAKNMFIAAKNLKIINVKSK